MDFLILTSAVQIALIGLTTGTGRVRLAPGQWVPMGIAVAGTLCAALALANVTA